MALCDGALSWRKIHELFAHKSKIENTCRGRVYSRRRNFYKCQAMMIKFGGNVNDRCGNLIKKQNSNQMTQNITLVVIPGTFWSKWYVDILSMNNLFYSIQSISWKTWRIKCMISNLWLEVLYTDFVQHASPWFPNRVTLIIGYYSHDRSFCCYFVFFVFRPRSSPISSLPVNREQKRNVHIGRDIEVLNRDHRAMAWSSSVRER